LGKEVQRWDLQVADLRDDGGSCEEIRDLRLLRKLSHLVGSLVTSTLFWEECFKIHWRRRCRRVNVAHNLSECRRQKTLHCGSSRGLGDHVNGEVGCNSSRATNAKATTS
jgi:hypothetical protein